MAETKEKKDTLEREYIIPLRNEWRKVANYRRTGRAIKEIKKFIARHMKVPDRDLDKVKLDIYLNNEIWFRGKRKPPAKIKVRARKEGNIVKVELADIPEYVKFRMQKHEKLQKKLDKGKLKEVKEPEKPKEDKEVKKEDEEKKKDEKEKEKSIANLRALEAKQDLKAQKHTIKGKEPIIHRMALKK